MDIRELSAQLRSHGYTLQAMGADQGTVQNCKGRVYEFRIDRVGDSGFRGEFGPYRSLVGLFWNEATDFVLQQAIALKNQV